MWKRISHRGIVTKQQQKPRWPPQTCSFSCPTQTSCIRNSEPCGPAFCAQPQGLLAHWGSGWQWSLEELLDGAHCKGIWTGMVKVTSFPRVLLRAGNSAVKVMIPHPLCVVLSGVVNKWFLSSSCIQRKKSKCIEQPWMCQTLGLGISDELFMWSS